MRLKLLNIKLCLVLLVSFSVKAQQYAEFTIKKNYKIDYNTIQINSKKFKNSNDVIKIRVNRKVFDTIYYKYRNTTKKVICNISHPFKCEFIKNDCCGTFSTRCTSKKHIKRNFTYNFKLKNTNGKNFLGTANDSGVIIKPGENNNVKTICKSVMSPPREVLRIMHIEPCKKSPNCDDSNWICFKDSTETNFKIISEKLNFEYLSLTDKQLQIIYDAKKNTYKLKLK